MTGTQDEIVWSRWIIYLLVGPPALFWLFFARDNVRRLVAVLFVLVFIQDSFVQRRFVWAISFGPSTVVAYVALMSLIMQRRGLPNLAPYGGAWGALIFFACGAAVAGSVDGYPFENVFSLQRFFLEGFLFFLVGYLAFRSDEELKRLFRFFVWIGIGVALAHFFALFTGYRFRGYTDTGNDLVEYGGLFTNANSMADFYAMVIPAALLMALRSERGLYRVIAAAAIPIMLVSLFLTGSRGGMLATIVLTAIALLWSRTGIVRTLVIVTVAGLLVALSYAVLSTLFQEFFRKVLEGLTEEGLESPRTKIWPCYLGIILRRPLGLGFATESVMPLTAQCALSVSTAHNIFLDMAAQAGFGALISFLILIRALMVNTARAVGRAIDSQQRLLLTLCFLAPAGFLIGGFFEPIFINSTKLNHVFWLIAGVGAGASTRVLAEARERENERHREPASSLLPAQARGV